MVVVFFLALLLVQTLAADTHISFNFNGMISSCKNSQEEPDPLPSISGCEVAIIGLGPGGAHTAYQLSSTLGSKVCAFEKNEWVGGRTHHATGSNGEVIPLGAIRVMESQTSMLNLAETLGIELEYQPQLPTRYLANGMITNDQLELKRLAFPFMNDSLTENDYWDLLRFSPKRYQAHQYLNLKDYVRDVIGNVAFNYMNAIYRFRGDFTNVDVRGYWDYFDEEWDVCCESYFPVKGMDEFSIQMIDKAKQSGVRVFLSERVDSIERQNGKYMITSNKHTALVNRVIIAADLVNFKSVKGDIAKDIQAAPQFQAIRPVFVTTINHVWPTRWWESLDISRAWTTDNCINFIEIAIHPSSIPQNRTRSVYDDGLCNRDWAELLQTQPISLVNTRLVKMLQEMFPEVTIPMPTETKWAAWPVGWVYLETNVPFTVYDIADWATNPLPGEAVSMVGENYNPRRSGWSHGAILSSWNSLEEYYGMQRPVEDMPTKRTSQERPPFSFTSR